MPYGLDYLRVSIYSVRKEHHREVTQMRVDPETIAQNVRFLYDYRHRGGKQKPFICAKIMDMGEVENEEFRSIYAPISDEQLIDIPWELPKTEESALSKLYGGKEAGKEAQKKFVESSVFKERKACRYPLCATCELPLHDRPEDAIDDLPVERLSWKEGQEDRT